MTPKEKIHLQWQDHIYEVGIQQPWPGQCENDETRADFASNIDDIPKQIALYLCGSLLEPSAPDLIHPYLAKLFQRKFSVGYHTVRDTNHVTYFRLYESDDYGSTVILINNSEARIQFER
ncbi:MAG: hypothetical protein WCJ45_01740 [bacterium]